MPRLVYAVAICLALAQSVAPHAWSQTVAPVTEAEKPQTTDAATACRQVPTGRCVADLLIAAIGSTNESSMRNSMLLQLALAQARGRDTAGALATLDRMKGDISNYSQILEAVTETQVAVGDIDPVLAAVAKVG